MKRAIAVLVVSSFAVSAASESARVVPISREGPLNIAISVPDSWGVIERPRDPFSIHRRVVIAMNNKGDDSLFVKALRIEREGGRHEFREGGALEFGEALPPGTVYLEVIAVEGGPPPINVSFAWTPDQQMETQVERMIRERRPMMDEFGVIGFTAGFVRWGIWWQVTVCGRKPFPAHDLERAFAAAKTLRFLDAPIVDSRQAIDHALSNVPSDMRQEIIAGMKEKCCRVKYDVRVVENDGTYRVIVDLMQEPKFDRVRRSATLDVSRDGTVTPVRD